MLDLILYNPFYLIGSVVSINVVVILICYIIYKFCYTANTKLALTYNGDIPPIAIPVVVVMCISFFVLLFGLIRLSDLKLNPLKISENEKIVLEECKKINNERCSQFDKFIDDKRSIFDDNTKHFFDDIKTDIYLLNEKNKRDTNIYTIDNIAYNLFKIKLSENSRISDLDIYKGRDLEKEFGIKNNKVNGLKTFIVNDEFLKLNETCKTALDIPKYTVLDQKSYETYLEYINRCDKD